MSTDGVQDSIAFLYYLLCVLGVLGALAKCLVHVIRSGGNEYTPQVGWLLLFAVTCFALFAVAAAGKVPGVMPLWEFIRDVQLMKIRAGEA